MKLQPKKSNKESIVFEISISKNDNEFFKRILKIINTHKLSTKKIK